LTTIDFYFNADDRLQVACRLTGKALAQRKRVVVFAPEPAVAKSIDQKLWTWPAISFVPHCLAEDPLAGETPVLIATQAESIPAGDVLLNFAADCPAFFERFDRLLEIVTPDEEDRRAARARYAWYRDRGYAIRNHDLAEAGSE
jgi:DNA polymerase-3 subunit chi